MGDQWSFKPDDKYKSTHQLIHLLVDIVGKGGNLLLNVGPRPDGTLPAEALARMREIGAWMKVNGEAIHGTRPIAPYKEDQVVFTRKGDSVYAILLASSDSEGPPPGVTFRSLRPADGSKVRLLGVEEPMSWSVGSDGMTTINVPQTVQSSPPCRHAFVFRFTKAGG
jgi:alpha-L-fucosidase